MSRADALSREFLEARRADLEERVGAKRLHHIEGVAETAAELAEVYDVDIAKARLAGMLHDWDKGYDDEGIRARVRELGIEDEVGTWSLEAMPQVLHGPTAAAWLSRTWPEIPEDVIEAIRYHTTASTAMSDLDKIIYISDAIEPSRTFEDAPYLRSLIGQVSLDELYFQVYKFWTQALIAHDVVLHPATIEIWNALARERPRAKGKGRR